MSSRNALRLLLLVAGVILAHGLDRGSGRVPDLTVLYLIPIILRTYWLGLRFGLALGVAALAAEVLAQPAV